MRRFVCNENYMTSTVESQVESIIQTVAGEFGNKADLFVPVVVRMDARKVDAFEKTKSPGVYVFLNDAGKCLKVGKSHSNASKRALEHCRDNTRSKDGVVQMKALHESAETYLLVFALSEEKSQHWILALEHFLEHDLEPLIRSRRNG